MEWSKLAIGVLIEAYSKETCLYNNKSPSYHNKHSRKDALDRICETMKEVRPTTSVEITSKMKSLRTTYVSELNKINNTMKSGVDSGQVYKPTIWYYDKFCFLKNHVQPRRGTCTADTYHDIAEDLDSTDDRQNIETSTVPINVDNGEWEVLQEEGHFSEQIVPSQNTLSMSGVIRNIRKRKRTSDIVEEENELLNRASNLLNSVTKEPAIKSELEVFGTYVTASLQDIKSKALVLRTKHEILNTIMKAQEEELNQNESM